MIKVTSLSFSYSEDKAPLFADVNFFINEGHGLHIRGANGKGKTTLLKMLAGIFQPHTGKISYYGKDIAKDLLPYQQNICYIGHKFALNPTLTIKENCSFSHHWQTDTIFEKALLHFGLKKFANEICANLSQGQRRKVSLLKLMVTKASIWLLDEPLVGLDEEAINSLIACFNTHLAKGGSLILTSHQQLLLGSHVTEYWL